MSSPSLHLAIALGLVLGLAGCDTGGLLLVKANGSTSTTAPPEPVAVGPSANEMVNGGTVAESPKYKVVYTLGQASPNQGVDTSKKNRLNGGLVGAMDGEK